MDLGRARRPWRGGREFAVCAAIATTLLAATPAARAATQIGETFPPVNNCVGPLTALQTTSPGGSYAAPYAGVITSWSFMAGTNAPSSLKLKVGRAAGGDMFTVVGASEPQTAVAPNVLNNFATRVPVRAGDVIGISFTSGHCSQSGLGDDYMAHVTFEDPSPGTTSSYLPQPGARADVSAMLEPDLDCDGFGDETQDSQVDPGCPILDTTAPQTTLADEPRKSSRNRHATFGFTSNEPGSSFECSLDGGDSSFAPCTSPLRLKVKRGGHVFRVRATDPAGNRDGTPAVSIWKVKKKK